MDDYELFMHEDELPKKLSKEEAFELLVKINEGDEKAKEKLVKHNIRLVIHEVTSRFKNVEYEKKELVAVGNIGLMKAIKTFDITKNFAFSTWAVSCIDAEICKFLRKTKKDISIDSIELPIYRGKTGDEIKIEDTLLSETDIAKEYDDKEIILIIRQIIKDLPDREREIIMLYFGFYNDKRYEQREISEKFGISQAQVSRLIKKIIKEIGNELEERELIELRKQSPKKTKPKKQKEEKTKRTIYEYLNQYKKEDIDNVLKKLTEDEIKIIKLRYGEDLNNPTPGKLSAGQKDKFYRRIIPKIKRLLDNPEETEYILFSKPTIWQKKPKVTKNNPPQKTEKITETITLTEEKNLDEISEVVLEKNETKLNSTSINKYTDQITKEDYFKILEILRNPKFSKMINMYSPKEAMIVSLKLGYIDGKTFSTEAIAEFLGIEEQEIVEITKKALLEFKEKMNEIIDETIKIAIEEKITSKRNK